jgi:uncharacterized protein YllA (UPF0747 family)
VDVDRELTLVFAWDTKADGLPVKRRIGVGDAAAARAGAARLTPNVLLRPVVERQILPTAAYLAGPGELAYFTQVQAVAETLELDAPLAIPRWSGMAVPRETDAVLERFGLSAADLRDPHAAETRAARADVPAEVYAALADLRAVIGEAVNRLSGAAPEPVLIGARNQFERRAERLERRIVAQAKRRNADVLGAIGGARAMLYPFGAPQERALNVVFFVNRYGHALCDRLLEGLPLDTSKHYLVSL